MTNFYGATAPSNLGGTTSAPKGVLTEFSVASSATLTGVRYYTPVGTAQSDLSIIVYNGTNGDQTQLANFAGRLPTEECEIFIANLSGAMGRVAADATAFGGRSAKFVMNVHTRWQDAADDARCMGWAREFFEATRPYASGTAYVNFLSDEDGQRLSSTYGGNFNRLSSLKKKYDPVARKHVEFKDSKIK